MIFSSKSDADFSLTGSDEQHTFHDERDVEHITNEVAVMKTTNNNTQHIIQSSNSRHHGTDVTNDNGELRDDDEVFIRAESAPHVSSVMLAVKTGLYSNKLLIIHASTIYIHPYTYNVRGSLIYYINSNSRQW